MNWARFKYYFTLAVVCFAPGKWVTDPNMLMLTFPLDRILRLVMLQWPKEIRSHASGGNCNPRQAKYRMMLACPTIISVLFTSATVGR